MKRQDNHDDETRDQLAEALAQIESLQLAAADAEARAETARQQLAEAVAAGESATAEAETLRDELAGAQDQVREAAGRYRAARLAANPDVPEELIPEAESIEGVDGAFEAAIKIVDQVRERLEGEGTGERHVARIPAGSPPRRPPDVSSLPASEKIRLGLQQLDERPTR
ncbi:MAG TPA: hypothetical protein VMR52_06705 [Dehalococcoidia bacterium]|nr:hypothetical protein [Dehalococcoidia bacterium]